MQSKSYGSVSVFWFEEAAVREALKRYLDWLKNNKPEVGKVYLFGSLASGIPVPGSDVDLALVVSHSDYSFLERGKFYYPEQFPVDLDLFVYTKEEVRQMEQESNSFWKQILTTGRLILDI